MKKIIYAVLVVSFLGIIFSFSDRKIKGAKLFVKSSWSEISAKEDSILFLPYSGAWMGIWTYSDVIDGFDHNAYKSSFENKNHNLWTIIHPKIIDGSLKVYSPYDPDNFSYFDFGGLNFPLVNAGSDSSFYNSKNTRNLLAYYLGEFGEESYVPLTNMWGEDSLDNNGFNVYPPRPFTWYSETYIIKYKIREDLFLDKNGDVKRREIKSIAPVVYAIDNMGQIKGEKEIFWLDFKELKPILKEKFYLDNDGKPVSFLDYFEKRKFKAKLIKEEDKVIEKIK